jgi:hypothetical protein
MDLKEYEELLQTLNKSDLIAEALERMRVNVGLMHQNEEYRRRLGGARKDLTLFLEDLQSDTQGAITDLSAALSEGLGGDIRSISGLKELQLRTRRTVLGGQLKLLDKIKKRVNRTLAE